MEDLGENQGRMAAKKGLEVNNHVNGYTTMKEMLFSRYFTFLLFSAEARTFFGHHSIQDFLFTFMNFFTSMTQS